MKESKYNKYDFCLFLLILCTAAGMWGGAFKPARIISIVFFVPLLLSYGKVKLKLIRGIAVFLVFLIIWSLFSMLWTPNIESGVSEWGNMILRILFFSEVIVFGLLSKNTSNTLVNGWSIAFLITAIIAVWELNTGNHLDISNYSEGEGDINLGNGNIMARQFAAATFYNYNGYVTFICFCLPFLFGLSYRWTRGVKQLMAVVPIVLVLYVFILNASRGGIIGFLIFAAVFFFYRLPKSSLSAKFSYALILVGVVLFFFYSWELISFYLEYRMENSGLSSSRTQIWVSCWDAFLETGFMGCGVGGVMDILAKHHAYIPQPHNFFIEVLLEFGIIVFVWMLVLMVKVYRKGRFSKSDFVKYVRNSSLLAIPFITMIDSGYVQSVHIWAFLSSLLLVNVKYDCAVNS